MPEARLARTRAAYNGHPVRTWTADELKAFGQRATEQFHARYGERPPEPAPEHELAQADATGHPY